MQDETFYTPKASWVLPFVLTCMAMFLFHHEIILRPNDYLLGDLNDGLKNYYTPWYHIAFGKSLWHFSGMNFPYGEQVAFTDNQPILSALLQLIHRYIFPIAPYTVGIINSLILLSFPISSIFIYKLLQKLQLPFIYATVAAVFITLLSPQLLRLHGHYALAYAWVVPALLLQSWHFLERPTSRKALWYGIFTLLTGMLHLYYFAISLFLITTISFAWLFTAPSIRHLKRHVWHFFLMAIVPFLTIKIWLLLTDNIVDRPDNPYGFLVYKASWESILLPMGMPLGGWINNVVKIRQLEYEGLVYLGTFSAIVMIAATLKMLWFVARFKFVKTVLLVNQPTFRILFWASFLMLLFSFGLPFIALPSDWLEFTGSLKQFRGIGRFAWVFFYCANLLVAFEFYRFVKNTISYHWNEVAAFIAIGLLCAFDVYSMHTRELYLKNHFELTLATKSTAGAYVKASEYKAILPFPYFHTGSENIWQGAKGNLLEKTFVTSLAMSIPTSGVQMSRSSLRQMYDQLEMNSNDRNLPDWMRNFSDKDKFLVLIDTSVASDFERSVLDFGTIILDANNTISLDITKRQLKAWKKSNQQVGVQLCNDSTLIESQNGAANNWFKAPKLNYKTVVNPINDKAAEVYGKSYTSLLKGLVLEETGDFILSCWIKIDSDRLPTSRIKIDTKNQLSDAVETSTSSNFQSINKQLIDGWMLIEIPFNLPRKALVIDIDLDISTPRTSSLFVSNLLIYKPETKICQNFNGITFVNNRIY